MLRSLVFSVRVLALVPVLALVATPVGAQVKVHTESIKSSTTAPAAANAQPTGSIPEAKPASAAIAPTSSADPIMDLSRLPEPVARTREKILAAARSGDLKQLAAVMQASGNAPIFSLNDDKDPVTYWKANFPDSDGVEVLSIVIEILDAGFVHVDKGSPQEMYVWPYFARTPLTALSAMQKVELFKLITGSDYKDMVDFGAYNFYRLGISPDGTWQFFVSGD
jgi:hypothetical protein